MNNKRSVIVYDTTLRDGEQAPGFSLTVEQKISMARQLIQLGIDVIEAGFPVTSEGDFLAVKKISSFAGDVQVSALARAIDKDIDSAWDAVQDARNPRLHVFHSCSDIHIVNQFNTSRDKLMRIAIKAIKRAKLYTSNIQFSAMDATRSDSRFLAEIYSEIIEAGATTINISDTVGYMEPGEMQELVYNLKENVAGIDKVCLSVHCHNDLGLATANTLAAVKAGVEQVECTVNGAGERAGNAALEEVAVGLHVKQKIYNAVTSIKLEQLAETSSLFTNLTGVPVQLNKAIVGANAFSHQSGIHQDGMLKHADTYQVFEPQLIGRERPQLIIGKHSGRKAIREKCNSLGLVVDENQLEKIVSEIKKLCDREKLVTDEELVILVKKVKRYQVDKLRLLS